MRIRGVIGATAVIAACTGDRPGPVAPAAPVIDGATVAANPANALSAVVSVRARNTDSVVVRFHLAAASTGDSLTPAVPVSGDTATVPVLGLLPANRYVLHTVAYGGGESVLAEPLDFTTDTLPSDLPIYTAAGPAPSTGYVVFAVGKYGIVIDNTGRVVWYHRFPNGVGLNFQAQPNGRYVARPPPASPGNQGHLVEIDPLGNLTRTLDCVGGLASRPHDVIALPDGTYWVMCDETRVLDLSGLGGMADARVTGTIIQHVGATGALLFQWSPFDHFEITDVALAERSGANVNWTHGNALDFDADGNLLVSFRNLNEITKIDVTTGAVVWRLGGLRNQFAMLGTPSPAFARQHGLRLAGAGRLLLLDNLGDPAGSRAERYVYDASVRAARLVASYGSSPAVTAQLGGTTQDLPGDRALVSFGTAGRVEEYDTSGHVVWRIEGSPGYIFRAQRIRSLYHPGVGSPR